MLVELFALFCIFGIPMSIPILNIWTRHQREMMQMRLRLQQHGEGNVGADLAALRQEIHALRETSMQYDLSFDAALQRLEQRVIRTEQNMQNSAVVNTPGSASINMPTGMQGPFSSFRPAYDTQDTVETLNAGR